ncbi:unnamed protein product [Diabrotica balteata]|uniref:Uncharacterized protein n=1 Tax=Diabrotica balteata TaxID=107213 RepID=A0A9N9XGH8_DIABA|nr:unnamed protein product [Diabrotica balteata]
MYSQDIGYSSDSEYDVTLSPSSETSMVFESYDHELDALVEKYEEAAKNETDYLLYTQFLNESYQVGCGLSPARTYTPALYGPKSKSTSIPTQAGGTRSSSPTLKTTTTERSRSKATTIDRSNKSMQNVITNICELEYPDLIFLAYAPSFPTYRMYIVSKDMIWKYDLNNEKIPTNAEQFIRYLPRGITNVTHVFQSSNGDLIGVSRNCIYAAAFPSLKIHIDNMVPEVNNARSITGLFQTNSGKKFVCFDGSFIEFNDKGIISRGRISDVFPGIPNEITSVFNYIDGHIYFLKKNIYYKFNEFTRSVVEKGSFNWNLFGFPCPDNELIKQLKSLLSKINLFYE